MIYIEVIQKGGRTGHKLKDYLTAFCFYFIKNYKIIYNDYFKSPEDKYINMFNFYSPDIFVSRPENSIIIEYSLSNWEGMQYRQFEQINERIENIQKENIDKPIIVQLHRATRIQLSNLYNWEKKNFIKKGTYDKITSFLKTQLLSYKHNNQIQFIKKDNNALNICIHIRKGDVYKRLIHQSVEYYENIINNLKKIECKKNIYIFSEKWENYNGDDVTNLINLKDKNTNIEVIFEGLWEYMIDILKSDIFVATIGQGSFSDLFTHYKNKNTIIIYNNQLRQNKFIDNMNNMLVKTDKEGNFDINSLKNNTYLKLPQV